MDSLGSKLKKTREDKGISLDQVNLDINIATRYLDALEAEDFSQFAGEAYIIGFLRNYSEYLGIPSEDILSRYRSLKIQEKPMPVADLLPPKPPMHIPRALLFALLFILIAGTVGLGLYYFLKIRAVPSIAGPDERGLAEYTMTNDTLDRRFYRGESIIITRGTEQYKLTLSTIGETISLAAPLGLVILDLGQDVFVDLDGDGLGDLRIFATEYDKQNSSSGAQLRLELDNALPSSTQVPSIADESIPELSSPALAAQMATSTMILSSSSAYPFNLQATFPGYCMFRYEIDRRERHEQYYQRNGDLNIQAQNTIRIWASNAQAVKVQIIAGGRTVPLELGAAGEVVAADIRWVRDDEKRYRLVFAKLD
ncbi:helix-turn-helix domain-containing protein [Breznakiellaceae bacterium SP9]